jgi:drug/metabolite transporter (DMT)-like permease
MVDRPTSPTRARLMTAFAAVYLVWGSTYLAIRFAVETMPPFLMAGSRFLLAGACMTAWALWRGAPRPTRSMWRAAGIIGALLLVGGNGGVVWAEQHVPSGITALLVATVPLWMVLLDWLRPGGRRPTLAVIVGVAVGLGGLALLVDPRAGTGQANPAAAGVLVVAALSWAIGSIYSKSASRPASPILGTGMQMLAGGALLTVLGLVAGEGPRFHPDTISTRSLLAWAYLVTMGSFVGFTAYVWLLRVTAPAKAATYAYVNPVVAVFLGWALADEPLTARTLVAAAIIVGAVALITTAGTGAKRNADAPPKPAQAVREVA